jgi:2-polyprenyl-3-methyl-5-hydroxy-6-metoxy-1,4-benzoquinol methylase
VDAEAKQSWFTDYVRTNYLPVIGHLNRATAEVLELACNRGFLLRALSDVGFQRLQGIDLSPDDVAQAQLTAPKATIICADALQYLAQNPEQFDLIVLKALLEHIPKQQILPLLEAINRSLRPGGMTLIDVPNMDWLAANHERYMDFTHEGGFTRESLAQVMRNVFADISVRTSVEPPEPRLKGLIIRLIRPAVILLARVFLRIIGEGASEVWWHSRSLIAVGVKGIS